MARIPQNPDTWTVNIIPRMFGATVIEADLAREMVLTQESVGRFLFLDCGLWAGAGNNHEKQRNFGVVHGNWAALCDFVYDSKCDLADALPEEAAPLRLLLQELQGNDGHLRLIKAMRYTGENERNQDTNIIEVFLGDTHIPVTNQDYFDALKTRSVLGQKRHAPDGASMGRWRYDAYPNMAQTMLDYRREDASVEIHDTRVLDANGRDWFKKYVKADIFENAAIDLLEFLKRLERFDRHDEQTEVRLIQTGDMLELWLGFERFFEGTPKNRPAVVLSPARGGKPSGEEFVDYWTNRACSQGGDNQKVLEALSRWPAKRAYFLGGNHDNYLLAHVGKLPRRRHRYFRDRLHAEHGHASCGFNRNGSKKGHRVTNGAFDDPKRRVIEPFFADARENNLELAASRYQGLGVAERLGLGNSRKPCLVVSGHSHRYGLGMVTLAEVRTLG